MSGRGGGTGGRRARFPFIGPFRSSLWRHGCLVIFMGKKGGVVTIAWYLQRGAKNSSMFEFPRLLPTHYSRAADAQPISPDVTCVTELKNILIALPCT